MHTIYAAIERVRNTFRSDDRGATAVEYGLMVALIAAVIAGVVWGLGQTLNSKFSGVSTCVSNTASCPGGLSSPSAG
ncbi:MAG TPA: Flp family type IVb pilin [Mycobacteriales bacterium]|jgi:pilus assembly protein Flp/PilA|nr:Flp family type IVb pilin [Mycobacteriales bacterium]